MIEKSFSLKPTIDTDYLILIGVEAEVLLELRGWQEPWFDKSQTPFMRTRLPILARLDEILVL